VGASISDIKYEKLFISGSNNLSPVGNKILSISPEHTQLFEMGLVRESFETMETYLHGFVALVTVILGSLSILFLFVYTYGKCKEEAEVFKMLRAIGLPVFDIRMIVFVEILIRIVVSIFNGIILGILFSLGLSGQIEEVLMINTPPIKLNTIFVIAALMLVLFAATVTQSTKYLTKRTVLETSKT
jgi:predicted lysophospholipase L1 biosynthesis ABC-type transport system permease subunit